jgi:hypothetical protein
VFSNVFVKSTICNSALCHYSFSDTLG